MQKVYERLALIKEIAAKLNKPFNMVTIIGKPASGKTTLAYLITAFLSRYFFFTKDAEALDIENLTKLKHEALGFWVERKTVFIFDDFSFAITGRSKEDRKRLKNLVEFRHIFGEGRRYYVILIAHYARSLAPVLRSAHIKILTSLDAAEVKLYSSEYMFSESTLLTYFEYLQSKPDQHLVLVSYGTEEKIMNLTLPYIDLYARRKMIKEIGKWKVMKLYYGGKKLLKIAELINIQGGRGGNSTTADNGS